MWSGSSVPGNVKWGWGRKRPRQWEVLCVMPCFFFFLLSRLLNLNYYRIFISWITLISQFFTLYSMLHPFIFMFLKNVFYKSSFPAFPLMWDLKHWAFCFIILRFFSAFIIFSCTLSVSFCSYYCCSFL